MCGCLKTGVGYTVQVLSASAKEPITRYPKKSLTDLKQKIINKIRKKTATPRNNESIYK